MGQKRSGRTWRYLLATAALALTAACSGREGVTNSDVLPVGQDPLTTAIDPANGPGQCLLDDVIDAAYINSGDVNCTSEDVDVALATASTYSVNGGSFVTLASTGGKILCSPGDVVAVNTSAQVINHAQERYDVGLWVGLAGGNALTGASCNHYNLVNGQNQSTNIDGDQCGDVVANVTVDVPLGTLTGLACVDGNPNADTTAIVISACAGWQNHVGGADRVCPGSAGPPPTGSKGSFRFGTTPETPAKCKCEPLNLPLDIRGSITITKDAVPNDGQDFTFNTTGSGLPGSFLLDDDGETVILSNTRLFPNLVAGTYTVTEAADPTGWQFTSLTCTSSGTGTSTSTASKTATITLGAGGTASCTYVNTRQGTITVIKDAVPNDAQDFTFTTTGAAPLGGSFLLDDDGETVILSNTKVFNNVPLGSYTVTEAADPAGWQFGSLSCTSSGTGTSTSTAGKVATITIGAAGSATCTYVNNKQGTITIIKDAVPNDAQDFTFTTTGAAPLGGSFLLDDDGEVVILSNTKVFNNVPLGSYTVTEAADPAGWQFGSLSCTSSGSGTSTSTAGKVATITISNGGSATCTYVNNKQGTITVIKDAVPNDAQDFTFTTTGAAPLGGSFLLDDDGETVILSNTKVFNNVPLGSYTVTEGADPAGWSFSSLSCTSSGTGTSTSTAAKVATITIGAGGSATCTYVNNGFGTITVIKDAVPNDAQDFTFTTTGAAPLGGSFLLDDDGETVILSNTKVFNNVPAGSYTVTEAADPAGWQFGSLSCTSSGAGTSTSTASKTATITLGAGGSATCTYVNNKQGTITIIKDAVPNDAQDFTFTTTGAAPLGGSFLLDDDGETVILSNTKVFNNVPLGSYTVTEAADPAGWQFGSLSCTSSGSGTSTSTAAKVATITIGSGGSATCTYVNNKQGTITIIKDAVPNSGQDFTFTTTGAAPLGGSFLLDDDGETVILSNTKVFNNVPLGSYTVTEAADPAGWSFTSLACTSTGSGTSTSTAAKVATITIGAGGTATCTYVNTELGTIIIEKEVVGGSTLQTFSFTRRISPSTSDPGDNPNPTMTHGGSSSSGKKLAANTYRVCEVNLAAGWANPTVTVNGVATALSVTDPVTGTFCVQVVLGAGETKTVHFVNTPPPGGGTRTIGYWKNHASCSPSNGNQYQKTIDAGFPEAVTDTHIDQASDPFYTAYPLGIYDGTPMLTCIQVVNLLDKSAINGDKRPGDPIYNMVAQMVGAKLNLAAGAGGCTALTNALTAASAYLVGIGFDGTGSYKDTISATDKALVLGWAAIFGSYNEGTLGGGCPTHV